MEPATLTEEAGPSNLNEVPTVPEVATPQRPRQEQAIAIEPEIPSCSFERVVNNVRLVIELMSNTSSNEKVEVNEEEEQAVENEGAVSEKVETSRSEEKENVDRGGPSGVSQNACEIEERQVSSWRYSISSAPGRLQSCRDDDDSSDDEEYEEVKFVPRPPIMGNCCASPYDGAGPSSVCNPTIDEEGQDEARALPERFYNRPQVQRTPLPETFREINLIWGPAAEREQLLKRFMGNPEEYAYNSALKRSEFWRSFANSVVTVNDVSIRQSLRFRKRVEIKPTRAQVPSDPSKHIYFLVRVYKPNKELDIDEMIPENMSSEFLIRGDLSLCALRDSILCLSDFSSYRDESSTPFFTNPTRTQIEYPSAYFFINNVFYNDMRSPNSVDLSFEARTIFEQKGLGTYQFRMMERTRLIDLPLTLGRPAIYMHQACCKHLFSFIAVRRATREDKATISGSSMRYLAEKCVVCTMNEAGWIVTGCRRLPNDPALICLPCYFYYFYGSNAIKKVEFRAFRYRAAELEPTNNAYFLEDLDSSSEASGAEKVPSPEPPAEISVTSSLSSLSDIDSVNNDELGELDDIANDTDTDMDSADYDLNDMDDVNNVNAMEGAPNAIVEQMMGRDIQDVNGQADAVDADGVYDQVNDHANAADEQVNAVDDHVNAVDEHEDDPNGPVGGIYEHRDDEERRVDVIEERANAVGGHVNIVNGLGERVIGVYGRVNGFDGGRMNIVNGHAYGLDRRANGGDAPANDGDAPVNNIGGRANGLDGRANGGAAPPNNVDGRGNAEDARANGVNEHVNGIAGEGNGIGREVNGDANGIRIGGNVIDEDVNDDELNDDEMEIENGEVENINGFRQIEDDNIHVHGQIRINGYGGNACNMDGFGALNDGVDIEVVDIDEKQNDNRDGNNRLNNNKDYNDRDDKEWNANGFNEQGWSEFGRNDYDENAEDDTVDGDGIDNIGGDPNDGEDDENEDDEDKNAEDEDEEYDDDMYDDDDYYSDGRTSDGDEDGDWVYNAFIVENEAQVSAFANSDTDDYSTDSDAYYI